MYNLLAYSLNGAKFYKINDVSKSISKIVWVHCKHSINQSSIKTPKCSLRTQKNQKLVLVWLSFFDFLVLYTILYGSKTWNARTTLLFEQKQSLCVSSCLSSMYIDIALLLLWNMEAFWFLWIFTRARLIYRVSHLSL